MENNIGIYLYTNVHTCKVYVGQSNNLHSRHKVFKCFNSRYAGIKIDRARKKYPHIEDWDYKILVYCSEEELDFYETYYIGVYDAVRSGYNCESGGNKNKHPDEETRKNMSKIQKVRCNTIEVREETGRRFKEYYSKSENCEAVGKRLRYYYNNNPEARKLVGERIKTYYANPENSKTHSKRLKNYYANPENREKMVKSHTHPIVQLTLDGEFVREWLSARQAKREGGYCNVCIADCIKNPQKQHKNYRWMEAEDYYKMIEDGVTIGKVTKIGNNIPVVQLTLECEFVREWGSATEAENEGGFSFRQISRCCKDINKTHKKHRWMKASEYYNKKESA